MANIKSQGTAVWASDDTALTKLVCLKTLDLGSDSTSKLENTCLEETNSKSYESGLSDPGEGSLGIDLDTENESHLTMIDWAQNKTKLTFYVLASDGTGDPTIAAGVVTPPAGRSYWTFDATITTPVPKFDADTLVGYTFTLQRSTTTTFHPKA